MFIERINKTEHENDNVAVSFCSDKKSELETRSWAEMVYLRGYK